MKSSFYEKTKRALVLLLTGAMIATSVPSNAFAATLDADADDVIIEEAVDAAQDAVVEEEVVENEPSDVVEALGAEEPVSDNSDTVEEDAAADTVRTITVDALDSADTAIASLTYGIDFTTMRFAAKVNSSAYKDVDWSIMSIDSDDIGGVGALYTGALSTYNGAQADYTAAQTAANKTALTDARTALLAYLKTPEALPTGMTGAENATSGAYEFKGPKALEVYDGWFVLVATDTDGTTAGNIGYSAPFNIKVSGVEVDAGRIGTLNAYYDYSATPKMNATGVVFGAAEDGYAVYDTKAEADAAEATNYTLSMPVILNTATGIDSNGAVVLSDASYKITDSAGKNGSEVDWFSVTANSTNLYSGSDGYVTLKVTPKSGLLSFGGAKPYVAYLHISNTAAFEEEVVVKLTFTVGQNITFSETIDGEENDTYTAVTLTSESAKGYFDKVGDDYVLVTSDTAVSGPYYIKDLGTYGIGQNVGTIKVTATSGGNDNLTITKTAADSIPEGLHVDAVKGKTATYTITGAADQAAGAVYDFTLTAKDEDTNNSLSIKYRLTTTNVDASTDDVPGLDIAIGDDKYTTGDNYEWYVGPSANDKAIDVVITNNTTIDLEFRPSFNKLTGTGTVSSGYKPHR